MLRPPPRSTLTDTRFPFTAVVRTYVKRGKNDAVDAEAICEAVTRPTMRYVAVKSREQQAALTLHRSRSLLVGQRTQLINMIRSLLAEFGIVIQEGRDRDRKSTRLNSSH